MEITDRSHGGVSAEVSYERKLMTSATAASLSHNDSHRHGNCYYIAHTVTAPSSGLNSIIHITSKDSDTDYDTMLNVVLVSCDTSAQWVIYNGTVHTDGTGGSATPINTNSGSSHSLVSDTYVSNVGNFITTTGTAYNTFDFFTPAYTPYSIPIFDTYIITYGKTVGISCKTTSGATIKVHVLLSRHRVEV